MDFMVFQPEYDPCIYANLVIWVWLLIAGPQEHMMVTAGKPGIIS